MNISAKGLIACVLVINAIFFTAINNKYDKDVYQIQINPKNLEYLSKEVKVQALVNKASEDFIIENKEEITIAITHASLKYKVEPEIILSVIAVESGFQKNAKSKAGAVGPMQVIPSYWRNTKIDPHGYYSNIQLGTRILSEYKDQCGNWKCAFKSYNVGITAYNNSINVPAQNRYYAKVRTELEKYNRI